MPPKIETSIPSGRLLIKGTALNFAGQVLPLIIGVVSLPWIVRGLGPERFGIFSLLIAIIGTFTLFDLGLPRATIRFLAKALCETDEDIFLRTFWTSLLLQSLLGILSGIILVILIPLVSGGVLGVSRELAAEANLSLVIVAVHMPFVMMAGCFRAALEAGQKFGVVNALKVPWSSSMYLIPVVALAFGLHLPGILFLMLIARLVLIAIYVAISMRIFPLLYKIAVDIRLMRTLLAFGGWILAANAAGTAMASLDRFVIAALETATLLGYYSAPVDALNRLFIVPTSLVIVLFPTLSAIGLSESHQLARIHAQAFKFMVLVMGPISLFLVLFAQPILLLWLGADFVLQSSVVFKLYAAGVFLSALGWVSYSMLQAIGRPELPAKFMLFELPVFFCLLWLLVRNLGIMGAALAWIIRVVVEVIWFFVALWRVQPSVFPKWARSSYIKSIVAVMLFASVSIPIIQLAREALVTQLTLFGGIFLGFILATWEKVLEPSERELFMSLIVRRFHPRPNE